MTRPPQGGQAGPPALPEDVAGWHRLHPLSPLVRAGRHLVTIGVLVLGLLFANHNQAGGDLVVDLVIVGAVLIAGVVSWLVTRWQVAGGVLRIETGLIRSDSRRFPLSQVQAIDVVQTGLARVLGLAELRLRTAGDASGGRLACLRLPDAERLRERLLSMAGARAAAATRGPAPATGAVGPDPPGGPVPGAATGPERVLFRVDSARLAGAIVLSRAGAIAAVVIAAMATVVALTGEPGTIAPFLPVGFGIVLAVWRQFNGEYGTRRRHGAGRAAVAVGTGPDHLRDHPSGARPGRSPRRASGLAGVWLVPPRGGRRRAAAAAGEPGGIAAPARTHPRWIAPGRRAHDRRAAGDPTAAVAASSPEGRLEGAVAVPLPGVGSRRPPRGGDARARMPEDYLGPPGKGAEHPLGAGTGPAPARACHGPARRRGQAGDRQHPGPRCRRGGRDPGDAARPGPRCADDAGIAPGSGGKRISVRKLRR